MEMQNMYSTLGVSPAVYEYGEEILREWLNKVHYPDRKYHETGQFRNPPMTAEKVLSA